MDIARGVEYLHRKRIIHRDLKSSNIMLDAQLRAYVSDFGLSHLRESMNQTLTINVGTHGWRAPEVVLSGDYGFPCDIFSFAMIGLELLSEKLPPSPDGIETVLSADFSNTQEAVSELELQQHESFRKLLSECASIEPSSRPDALAVLGRLRTILALTPTTYSETEEPSKLRSDTTATDLRDESGQPDPPDEENPTPIPLSTSGE